MAHKKLKPYSGKVEEMSTEDLVVELQHINSYIHFTIDDIKDSIDKYWTPDSEIMAADDKVVDEYRNERVSEIHEGITKHPWGLETHNDRLYEVMEELKIRFNVET